VGYRLTSEDLSAPGVVLQRHEEKQGDDLLMLGDRSGRLVTAHHMTRFLAGYRVGQERYGIC